MLRASELADAVSLIEEMKGPRLSPAELEARAREETAKGVVAGPFEERTDPKGHVTYHRVYEG